MWTASATLDPSGDLLLRIHGCDDGEGLVRTWIEVEKEMAMLRDGRVEVSDAVEKARRE